MSTGAEDTVFDRNLRFFDAVSPGISAGLRALQKGDNGRRGRSNPLDLEAEIALERFFWRPMPIQAKSGASPDQHLFMTFSKELYSELEGLKLSQIPRAQGGFLFLFGVPQKNELEDVLRRTPARTLILAESDGAAFGPSSYRIDWQKLAETLNARGGRIRFVLGDEAVQLANAVQAACLDRNFAWLDGSYHSVGRATPLLNCAYDLFINQLPNLQSSAGFFEDELRMMGNTIANVQTGGERTIFSPGSASSERNGAALIIASGPSASESLETIQQAWGDRPPPVSIITAGTGLALARAHGITPDYHCEIENVSDIQQGLLATLGEEKQFQTVLVAPTSVAPEIPPLFSDCLHFVRGFGAASSLFSQDLQPLDHSSPTVTNLAVRLAKLLGAKDIMLVGADFGTLDREQHHAKGSIYDDALDKGLPASFSSEIAPFEIPVKAVDGTRFLTNQILLQSAQHLSVLAAQSPDLRVIRCGTGVAVPNLGQFSGEELLAWLQQEHTFTGKLTSPENLAGQYQPDRFKSVSDWAEGIFDASQDFKGSIEQIVDQVMADHFKAEDDPRNVVLLFGTVMLCFQLGVYLHNRVADKDRSAVDLVFGRLFRKLLYAADREWIAFKRQHNL